ncbi:MAG: WD40 repeat domain-containing protein, partial [Verrucomicrobiales bacterium]|nr:WD40 repeat domain-containing protein [Verrucomicrobiales bacterium]
MRKLTGIKGKANAVLFSADGQSVFAAGGEAGIIGEVKQWKTSDGTLMQSYAGHLDAVYALALSPDGKMLVTGAYDQKIRLWDVGSGKELAMLKGHNGAVNGLSFRPDGKVLASASGDRTVKLWAIPGGTRLDTLSQPTKEQTSVVFSADGQQLYAGGGDNRIRIWKISSDAKEGTNKILTSRFAHEGGLLNIAISSDGKLLATSASDRSLKIWNTTGLTVKQLLEKQPDWTGALAFTDKSQLVTGRVDGSLSIYDSTTGKTVMAPKPAAPAKAVAAAKPELSRLTPRGIQSGTEILLTLNGKNITENTKVMFSHPGLVGVIAKKSVKPTSARVKITAAADIPRAAYEVWLHSSGGDSAKMKIYVDDLATTITTADDFKAGPVQISKLPASVWGTLTEVGQHDAYLIQARKGEELVFDLGVAQIGSAAKSPTIEIVDTNRTVLAVNRGLDSGSDPFLAWAAPADGNYIVLVSNTTMDGSADHVYRLTMGALPYVTGWSPLAAQVGKPAEITLIGHHLTQGATVKMVPEKVGTIPATGLAKDLRFRSLPMLRVTSIPQTQEAPGHDDPKTAQVVTTPITISGSLDGPKADADFYAFDAKKGQTWIIETLADQAGSPADTKLDLLHPDGSPVPHLLLQSVRDSYNNFRSVDANNPDIRLQNWEEMELNEYVCFNGDVMRIFRQPRGPDGGTFFYITGGKRRAYFDTTATSHSLDEPCYVVTPQPLGSEIVPNGLPVFTLNYCNDDAGSRKLGHDSSLTFTAPADGRYIVRVTDTRGWGGERFVYAL